MAPLVTVISLDAQQNSNRRFSRIFDRSYRSTYNGGDVRTERTKEYMKAKSVAKILGICNIAFSAMVMIGNAIYLTLFRTLGNTRKLVDIMGVIVTLYVVLITPLLLTVTIIVFVKNKNKEGCRLLNGIALTMDVIACIFSISLFGNFSV